MLGSALPATATLHTTTSTASPTSPTRASRLRGLTYLRNYTYSHLHSSSSSSSRADAPPLPRSASASAIPDTPTSPREQASSSYKGREEATIQSGENGWLPTVQGRSGLSRDSLHPTSTTESASPERSNAGMTRSRASQTSGPSPATASSPRRSEARREDSRTDSMADAQANDTNLAVPEASTNGTAAMPTIRLIPHIEVRAARPSLQFTVISRTLDQHNSIVRVGRYSERENTALPANQNSSSAPVGFKSKVVSRRHCEFWCTNGQWYVKDVKSSSGTFLNHVRLSAPGSESFPYPVNDGDVVQLGMDFKGGEEVIFRCVKIRIECNRGWQKGLNNYNKNAHKRLFKKAGVNGKTRDSDSGSTSTSECSICLNPVAPCQALFVAPCSHVWHYKCVRNLIHGPNWPNFLCPNCRFVADLEADVEQPEDFEEVAEDEDTGKEEDENEEGTELVAMTRHETQESGPSGGVAVGDELADQMESTSLDADNDDSPLRGGPDSGPNSENKRGSLNASTRPVDVGATSMPPTTNDLARARSATPTSTAPFSLAVGVQNIDNDRRGSDTTPDANGPLTPRNDAGPFILDGNAGLADGNAGYGNPNLGYGGFGYAGFGNAGVERPPGFPYNAGPTPAAFRNFAPGPPSRTHEVNGVIYGEF